MSTPETPPSAQSSSVHRSGGHAIQTAQRYERELLESCIPFWEKACPDAEHGGYFNFLERDGRVFDPEKSMWMQWRIVYMFATLYASEYRQDRWLDLARQGFDFLTRHGKDAEGHYYFSLTRQGEPMTAAHSIYSSCFAAIGAAALYRVTADPSHRAEALSAFEHYCERIDNPKGRWDKSMSGKPRRQALGHYMMLANLGAVLNECLDTRDYDQAISDAAGKVLGTFWQPQRRQLFENANPDGSIDLESCDGRHLNPGHGLEAMWFLLQAAEATGDTTSVPQICEIVLALLEAGWDPEFGGFFYFMDAEGYTPPALEWDMKLWWVHNEALLACLYAHRASGDDRFLDWFARVDEWTWARFPDRDKGEWFGYLNRRGEVTHTYKGSRWKGFFHLPRCLLLGTRLLKEIADEQHLP